MTFTWILGGFTAVLCAMHAWMNLLLYSRLRFPADYVSNKAFGCQHGPPWCVLSNTGVRIHLVNRRGTAERSILRCVVNCANASVHLMRARLTNPVTLVCFGSLVSIFWAPNQRFFDQLTNYTIQKTIFAEFQNNSSQRYNPKTAPLYRSQSFQIGKWYSLVIVLASHNYQSRCSFSWINGLNIIVQ